MSGQAFAHGFGQTEPALDHLFLRVMTAIGQLQSQFDRTVRRAGLQILPHPFAARLQTDLPGACAIQSHRQRCIQAQIIQSALNVLCGFRLIDRDHNLGVNRTNRVNALRMRGVQPMFKTGKRREYFPRRTTFHFLCGDALRDALFFFLVIQIKSHRYGFARCRWLGDNRRHDFIRRRCCRCCHYSGGFGSG